MRICKLTLILTLVSLFSGCGSKAIYLKSGTVCVLEKSVTVQAAVPGADGKLNSGTVVELPIGTEFKYNGAAK